LAFFGSHPVITWDPGGGLVGCSCNTAQGCFARPFGGFHGIRGQCAPPFGKVLAVSVPLTHLVTGGSFVAAGEGAAQGCLRGPQEDEESPDRKCGTSIMTRPAAGLASLGPALVGQLGPGREPAK
jgi:hypothetical protein